MEKKDLIPKISRGILAMQAFKFETDHRAGTQMKHVDALSRIISMISVEDNLCIKIRKMQQDDDDLKPIRIILQQQESYDDYFLRNNIIYKYASGHELLVVPKAMETEVIKTAHENGHFGV